MTNTLLNHSLNALPSSDDITREVIPNGIVVLTRTNFNNPTLSIKGFLHSGSLLDPQDQKGLSYLTASNLMSGTATLDMQDLYQQIESVGASLGFSSGTLTTPFSAHCLSEDLDLILGLIAECLQKPIFPKNEFNRKKTQLLTGLAIRAQSTSEMAALLFDQMIYNDHPYQHPDEGYPDTVETIGWDDLDAFYEETYGPQGMTIAIVGDVEPHKAIDAVKNALGDWTNPDQVSLPTVPDVQPLAKTTRKNISIPGKFQADIVMGTLAPPRKSPDYHALRIGNNILGQFGMMGRLGQRVREQAGLAYYVYSNLSMGIGPGTWEMIAGINPANIDKTIELITEEVKKFNAEPVTDEELEDSKSYFLGIMPLMLESNSGVAVSLLNMERFELGLDYFLEYPNQVQAITAEDILETSRKYLNPDQLAIAVASP